MPWDQVVLAPNPHVTYYPGARPMTMKVIFAPDSGRILGAQIVGFEGVDKRIDVLATAIQAGMTAAVLKALDLAYAPPYSSAKDPVNMAGFMIENLLTGKVKQYHSDDVAALPRDGSVTLLDTRTSEEYARGHAAGFINIPPGRSAGAPRGNPRRPSGLCYMPERAAQLSGLPNPHAGGF